MSLTALRLSFKSVLNDWNPKKRNKSVEWLLFFDEIQEKMFQIIHENHCVKSHNKWYHYIYKVLYLLHSEEQFIIKY